MFTLCLLAVALATAALPFILPQLTHYFGYATQKTSPVLPIIAAVLFLVSFYLPDIHISSQTVTFQQHFVGGGMFCALLYIYTKQQLRWRTNWFIEFVLLFAWVSTLGVANELLEFGISQAGILAIDTADTTWDLLANTSGAYFAYCILAIPLHLLQKNAQKERGQLSSSLDSLKTEMPKEIVEAHAHSSDNDEILSSRLCGCFYCLNIFKPSEITEWVNDNTTPLCPQCGIDSIIGDQSGYPITKDFLKQMHQHWF